jgi:hypothetical protein
MKTEFQIVERHALIRVLVFVWLVGIIVGFGLGLVVGGW